MKTLLHKASDRGHADHGWLKSNFSFSFAEYYDPSKIHFGLLRVLNDDTVAPGTGFGIHPHDNMEIVTIPLAGELEHADTMGNRGVIRRGDVQIMSAGTGIRHSEKNSSAEDAVRLFQIWIFPKEKNITPRYDQKTFLVEERKNKFHTVVSPKKVPGALWINQDAFFSLGDFEEGKKIEYTVQHPGNGVFVMVIEGDIEIAGEKLSRRDAIGVWETGGVPISVLAPSELLVIEVPMN